MHLSANEYLLLLQCIYFLQICKTFEPNEVQLNLNFCRQNFRITPGYKMQASIPAPPVQPAQVPPMPVQPRQPTAPTPAADVPSTLHTVPSQQSTGLHAMVNITARNPILQAALYQAIEDEKQSDNSGLTTDDLRHFMLNQGKLTVTDVQIPGHLQRR